MSVSLTTASTFRVHERTNYHAHDHARKIILLSTYLDGVLHNLTDLQNA